MTRVCALALVVATFASALMGCSSDESSSPSTTTRASTSSTTSGGDDAACAVDGVDGEMLADVFGADFDEPEVEGGEQSINDLVWTSTGCTWASPDVRVSVLVAGPDDFPDGYECPTPVAGLAETTAVDGIGDQAWWTWSTRGYGGGGRLDVCSGEERIEITVRGPERRDADIDEAEARADAEQVAETMLQER